MFVDQSEASACGADHEEGPRPGPDRVGRDLLAHRLDRLDGERLVLDHDLDRSPGGVRDDRAIGAAIVQ
jgi:hypothetical protein